MSLGATGDIAATVKIAALRGRRHVKGRFRATQPQLGTGCRSALQVLRVGNGNPGRGTAQGLRLSSCRPCADQCSQGRRVLTRKSAYRQLQLAIGNRRAGLDVLGERDVSCRESSARHEAHPPAWHTQRGREPERASEGARERARERGQPQTRSSELEKEYSKCLLNLTW